VASNAEHLRLVGDKEVNIPWAKSLSAKPAVAAQADAPASRRQCFSMQDDWSLPLELRKLLQSAGTVRLQQQVSSQHRSVFSFTLARPRHFIPIIVQNIIMSFITSATGPNNAELRRLCCAEKKSASGAIPHYLKSSCDREILFYSVIMPVSGERHFCCDRASWSSILI
jgi:hypothetical protein